VHQLLQHEAEHRSQIVRLRDALSGNATTDVQIRVRPNGSYKVYGPVSVLDPQEVPFDLNGRRKTDPYGERIKLCRCGASSTMPFCDDSHVETEFCSVPSAATSHGPADGNVENSPPPRFSL
jgi:CDGSH-type Zn-finger protein